MDRSLEYAQRLDAEDPLREFRGRFVIDDPDLIYLDGNSLGRLTHAAAARAQQTVREEWGSGLIGSWNRHWFDLPQRIGARIAQLVSARPHEVVVADSTSVNLFKLALAALRARPGRRQIVTDALNFPSDVYVLQSAAHCAGSEYQVIVVPSRDGMTVPLTDLQAAVGAETALVCLSHTTFKSAFVHDMAQVTALAHERGALTLWDLSHSVGALPIDLNGTDADLAVGCTYKYLNGGPGAPAFLYVREDLSAALQNPLAGWFGHAHPFGFALEYEPLPDARRFLTGTPPIVSLSLVEAGVDLVLEAGIERLREKSVRQTEYLVTLWRELLRPLGYTLNSPEAAASRGSHVSLGHPEGYRINRALIERMRVIPDFRHPDNIRLGVTPLYTTCVDIYRAVEALRKVAESRIYLDYSRLPSGVT